MLENIVVARVHVVVNFKIKQVSLILNSKNELNEILWRKRER